MPKKGCMVLWLDVFSKLRPFDNLQSKLPDFSQFRPIIKYMHSYGVLSKPAAKKSNQSVTGLRKVDIWENGGFPLPILQYKTRAWVNRTYYGTVKSM